VKTETILIPHVYGRCRWCQCTDRRGCVGGCSWSNGDRSLCSNCDDIDKMVRTPSGRRFIAGLLMPLLRAAANKRKRRRPTTTQRRRTDAR
jgi:hypothetical protein